MYKGFYIRKTNDYFCGRVLHFSGRFCGVGSIKLYALHIRQSEIDCRGSVVGDYAQRGEIKPGQLNVERLK